MRKFGPVLILTLTLALTACTRSLSAAPTQKSPLPTPTAGGVQSLLDSGATEDPMAMLQQFATQTALAQGALPAVSATPTPTLVFGTTPNASGTLVVFDVTSTPLSGSVLPTVTPNIISVASSTPGHPGTYTLLGGEFPFCIARRFNVDPSELLSINGLSSGQLYSPGLSLKIPQSGNPFPGSRALRAHPATYTVTGDDTIYSVACLYGDVDPVQIAAANSLSAPYTLQVGQSLSIP